MRERHGSVRGFFAAGHDELPFAPLQQVLIDG
jgi:hypothetical protein